MDGLIKILAKYLVLIPPLAALYLLVKMEKEERKRAVIRLVAIGILSLALATLVGHLYVNPRPPFKDGSTPLLKPSDYNGFPSDHTLFSSAIAFWAMFYSRKWGWLLLAVALVIGWARVAAHVHHAVDIAGAFALTAISYYLVLWLEPKFLSAKKTHKS